MNYELAKELKDAGFPQGYGQYVGKDWKGGGNAQAAQQMGLSEGAYVPTLSELIEACGNDFLALSRLNGQWTASAHNPRFDGDGSTPEEAAARLWLAIRKA
jgi:hypothetical protein